MDPNQSKEQQKEIPVNLNRNIDILWVVDNSGSMEQEQQSLVRNFPEFVRVLEGIEGGLPDIHMGVVSSDVGTPPYDSTDECNKEGGDNGVLQVDGRTLNEAGDVVVVDCPDLTGGRYIEDLSNGEDGTRQKNYSGDLADQFSCMAKQGTGGCGFEQHLGAMKAALENTTDNAGFLRDNAFLAVIFIQDEDDCSASDGEIFNPDQSLNDRNSPLGELSSYRCFEFGTSCQPDAERTTGPRDDCTPEEDSPYIAPVTDYIDFLRGLKDDPSQVIVAAVTAPAEPANVEIDPDKDELWVQPACVVCDGGGADCDAATHSQADAIVAAAPAVRMNSFLGGFPSRSTFQNICTYDPAINDVDLSGGLTQIGLLLKRVVGNPCIEGKLAEPVDCRVSDVRDLDLDTQEEFPIQSCDDSSAPCFRLVDDQTCMTESNLALEIDRGDPPQDPPPNTTVVVRCLVN